MMQNMQKSQAQHEYEQLVKSKMPKSRAFTQCIKAFVVGGIICCIGQLVGDLGTMLFSFTKDDRAAFAAIVLVFLGALLTGLDLYSKIGQFAGAGSVVPITGFANSIVAPAIEYKREGFVMGVGANMFSIAGPVLVFGIGSSVIVGIIYYILGVLGCV